MLSRYTCAQAMAFVTVNLIASGASISYSQSSLPDTWVQIDIQATLPKWMEGRFIDPFESHCKFQGVTFGCVDPFGNLQSSVVGTPEPTTAWTTFWSMPTISGSSETNLPSYVNTHYTLKGRMEVRSETGNWNSKSNAGVSFGTSFLRAPNLPINAGGDLHIGSTAGVPSFTYWGSFRDNDVALTFTPHLFVKKTATGEILFDQSLTDEFLRYFNVDRPSFSLSTANQGVSQFNAEVCNAVTTKGIPGRIEANETGNWCIVGMDVIADVEAHFSGRYSWPPDVMRTVLNASGSSTQDALGHSDFGTRDFGWSLQKITLPLDYRLPTNGRVEVGFTSTHEWEGIQHPLLGDLNFDELVDNNDLNELQKNLFQRPAGWMDGDFNGDWVVDGSDFNLWYSHQRATSETNVVPEPLAGYMLLLPIIVAFGAWRRRGISR